MDIGGTVDVIAPTYREVQTIRLLIERLDGIKRTHSMEPHLTIFDDNSADDASDLIGAMKLAWVTLIVRTKDRGLNSAVLVGIAIATLVNFLALKFIVFRQKHYRPPRNDRA